MPACIVAPALARGLAWSLVGAAAGLAAGALIVAAAPVVGRTTTGASTAQAAPGDDASCQAGHAAPRPISAVLASAIDAGVLPAPDAQAEEP